MSRLPWSFAQTSANERTGHDDRAEYGAAWHMVTLRAHYAPPATEGLIQIKRAWTPRGVAACAPRCETARGM